MQADYPEEATGSSSGVVGGWVGCLGGGRGGGGGAKRQIWVIRVAVTVVVNGKRLTRCWGTWRRKLELSCGPTSFVVD